MQEKNKKILLTFVGCFAGLINGFFAGGGGMIIVPFLLYIMKENEKVAQATSLCIMLPLTFVSLLFKILFTKFTFSIGMFSILGVVLGGAISGLFLKKINNKILRFVFIFLTLFAGVKMMF